MKVSVIGRGMYVEEKKSQGWYEEDDPNGSHDILFELDIFNVQFHLVLFSRSNSVKRI